MTLAQAARDTWRTVWLVDHRRQELGNVARLLRRLGPVHDVSDVLSGRLPEPLDRVRGLMVLNEGRFEEGARLAARLEVPFLSDEAIVNLTHKAAQRAAFRRAGIPTPEGVVIPAGSERDALRQVSAHFPFPAVVKPVQGRSSRDTGEVRDGRELEGFLADRGLPTAEDFLLEERIPDGWHPDERPWGDYVSVESFLSAGRLTHFGITGRTPLASGFRETGNVLPSNLDRRERDDLLRLAEQAIESLGARIGVFHTEIKLSSSGPRIIEVNGRLGGGGLSTLAESIAGRSLLRDAGRTALGLPVDFDDVRFDGVGFTWYLPPPEDARLVTAIDGLDDLARLPGVQDVTLRRDVGQPVDPAQEGSLSSPLVVTGRAEHHGAVWRLIDQIRSTVTVEFA